MENEKTTVNIEEVIKQEEATKQEAKPEEKPEEKPEAKAETVIDYDKLDKIINGRQSATEESVLKGYFKQQGMEQDEVKAAIEAYKQRKAEQTPDIGAMQAEMQASMAQATQQIQAATQRALNAEMQAKAILMASELGVDTKSMPFIIRAANTTEAIKDGAIDEAKLRSALNEVVDAIPALKQTMQAGGFQTVGADVNNAAQTADDDAIMQAFGVKK